MWRKNDQHRGSDGDTITILDIGASSIVCLIAQNFSNGTDSKDLEILGFGIQASPGLSAGCIDDLGAMETAIRLTVDTAEKQYGDRISSVFVNVSAGAFAQEKCRLDLKLSGSVVNDDDMVELFSPLNSRASPAKYTILKTTLRGYSIDHSRSVKDPRGLHADMLSAEVHRLFAPLSPLEDIVSCVHLCHLEVDGIFASAEASAMGCLASEESKHGAVMLDIGAGSTAMSIYRDNALEFVSRIPVAGQHFTKDLAQGLGIEIQIAERLKILHGTVNDPGAVAAPISISRNNKDRNDQIEFTARQISEVLAPRASDLLELVAEKMAEGGYNPRTPRIALTGGGSLLGGLREMVVAEFNAQARIAKPVSVKGISETLRQPNLSTAIGMLKLGSEYSDTHKGSVISSQAGGSFINKFWKK